MSKFSDLYEIIENDDIDGLKACILSLGVLIHLVRIHGDMTAAEFASWLGHFQQVKLLLTDYTRAARTAPYLKRMRIFENALFKRENDIEFFHEIMIRHFSVNGYGEIDGNSKDLVDMASAGAFEELDVLVGAGLVSAAQIVKAGFEAGSPRLVGYIMEHREGREFRTALDERFQVDPLEYVILTSETDADLTQLLAQVRSDCEEREQGNLFFREKYHVYWTELSDFDYETCRFLHLLVKIGNVDMFTMLMDPTNMAHVVRITGMSAEKVLLAVWLELADGFLTRDSRMGNVESPEICKAILYNPWMRRTIMKNFNIHNELIRMLSYGKKTVAEVIRPFCDADDPEREIGVVERVDLERVLDDCNWNRQADELEEGIGSVAAYIASCPNLVCDHFYDTIGDLPEEMRRPDMIERLRKFIPNLAYTKMEIVDSIVQEAVESDNLREQFPLLFAIALYECEVPTTVLPEHEDSKSCDFYISQLGSIFLAGGDDPITITCRSRLLSLCDVKPTFDDSCTECYAYKTFFWQGIIDSGRELKIEPDVQLPGGDLGEFVKSLVKERRDSISLLKLSRCAVRGAIRRATIPPRSITDSIVSLHTQVLLPDVLVRYLLFRDEPEGIYYKFAFNEL